jgi:hypothetical protein
MQQRRKSFLQGLKPVESTQFTSALKHRPPEEKDFFRSLLSQNIDWLIGWTAEISDVSLLSSEDGRKGFPECAPATSRAAPSRRAK